MVGKAIRRLAPIALILTAIAWPLRAQAVSELAWPRTLTSNEGMHRSPRPRGRF